MYLPETINSKVFYIKCGNNCFGFFHRPNAQ